MVRLAIRRPSYTLSRRKGGNKKPTCASFISTFVIGLVNRSSLLMLCGGMMIGYILLPMLVTQDGLTDVINESISKSSFRGSTTSNSSINIGNSGNTHRKPMLPLSSSSSSSSSSRSIATETAQSRILMNQKLLSSQSVPTTTTPQIIKTAKLPDNLKKRIMVTGGAGFVGSHLVDKLMGLGHEVIVVDNFFTGQKKNIEHWMHHPNFRYVHYFDIDTFVGAVGVLLLLLPRL
jgi:hypothetical protein